MVDALVLYVGRCWVRQAKSSSGKKNDVGNKDAERFRGCDALRRAKDMCGALLQRSSSLGEGGNSINKVETIFRLPQVFHVEDRRKEQAEKCAVAALRWRESGEVRGKWDAPQVGLDQVVVASVHRTLVDDDRRRRKGCN